VSVHLAALVGGHMDKTKWHRMNRRCQEEVSEQAPEDRAETMSSALKQSLQHRMIRWGTSAIRRINDISSKPKIPSAPDERKCTG
jgi:hypothetical protein